ncbi:MAG TPA: type 4a pilus biogenesis protein PilO [Burkholderiales bacterium]|jgi:type IV pilus assembly protein PilO|nr:type 4a pilus biogenesis protein PilO [Burkholderiales bacterium]
MTLDDIRRLNPRDIGSWPVLPKLTVLFLFFVVMVFGSFWFDWRNQLTLLDSLRQKEQELRTVFLDKQKQAVNLEAYRQQLATIEEEFGEMLKQLPNKSEMEALLTDINQAGLGRGLQFQLFRPAPAETKSEFYAELPITIKLTGTYHDMGAFASDISQLPRIVTLNDISLSADKDGLLTMDAIARTYRYLDEAEVAAQRKAARAGQQR